MDRWVWTRAEQQDNEVATSRSRSISFAWCPRIARNIISNILTNHHG